MIHLLNKTGSCCRSVFFTGEISPVSPVGGKTQEKEKKKDLRLLQRIFARGKIPPQIRHFLEAGKRVEITIVFRL
jgi:hypothetical protein